MTPDRTQIAAAVQALAAGELVGMPTETVYGLAADATQPDAVRKIFRLKGRPSGHPLIVHLHAAEQLEQWATQIPQSAFDLAQAFWPGPLTVILQRHPQVCDEVTGGHPTIGLRIPAHPVAQALLAAFAQSHSGAVAAPSANRFGRVSPTQAQHLRQEFGDALPCVLDGGPCTVGIESTIVDLTGPAPTILRPGQIGAQEIAVVVGPLGAPRSSTAAPGTLSSHYAVRVPTYAKYSFKELGHLAAQRIGWIGRGPAPDASKHWELELLGDEPGAFAQGLYAALRRLEGKQVEAIYIEALPQSPAWRGVADRVARACAAHRE